MIDEPELRGRRLILALLLCAVFILNVPVCSYGTEKTSISGYFKPSIANTGYSYTWHYKIWLDYCPACHSYNCLLINPKGVPESEITCGRCDADFDGCTGIDKGYARQWQLHKYVKKVVKPIVKKDIGLSKRAYFIQHWKTYYNSFWINKNL